MRLALALTEEDPEGKGAEGEDPMREVGAVIEKGLCSSRSTKGFCLQSRLSHFDKCQLKKEARRKEEGMGGSESKEFDPTRDIQHDASNVFGIFRS
jgi:hypothetical protein